MSSRIRRCCLDRVLAGTRLIENDHARVFGRDLDEQEEELIGTCGRVNPIRPASDTLRSVRPVRSRSESR